MTNATKIILGFDCSSTTVGWAALEIDIITNTIKLLKVDYLKPLKTGNIIERIVDTRDKIKAIIEKVKPDEIAIEEIVKFMKGKSSANTIIMLTTFNRMICLAAYDYLQLAPTLYSVLSIRHGLKLNGVFPAKEDIPDLVAKHLGIQFPWEYGKKGKVKVENYDKADGIAVALYHAFVLLGRTKKKKAKKAKKDKAAK
jgi:Holliday junction resolvasome RuvABC endonuclease subunit